MSSDENEIFNRNPKNKVCPLPDSSRSSSDGSPIIGSSSSGFKRRNVRALNESSASVSSNSPEIVFKRKKTARLETDSDFSTDDNLRSNRKKRLIHRRNVLLSDSGDSDSDLSSIIVPRRMRNHLIMSDSEDSDQWESDFSDEASYFDGNNAGTSVLPEEKSIESDSSDGQSEKCPICLLSFRLQEVGIPENCEHTFCLECLQEWSKNMNTCPVDRKEYHSITVKKLLNGKFMRKIPIERPAVQDDSVNIIEDPTFCQICGSSGDEDRMLLCDECDLGFHLYCLDPPLSDVPEGSWFCSQCVPMERVNLRMGLNAVMNWINVAESLVDSSTQPERRTSLRRISRTAAQSERTLRHRIANNRRNQQNQYPLGPGVDPSVPSTSDNRVSRTSTGNKKPRKKSRKSRGRKTRSTKSSTVWVLNDLGEAVPVRKKVSSKRRKYRKKNGRRRYKTPVQLKEKSVKKRLATQLGICSLQNAGQLLPDVRVSGNNGNNIGNLRYQSGIPNLDIFGRANHLEYFSQSEDEGIFNESETNGVHIVLTRRTQNPSNGLIGLTRRKAALVETPTVSSSTDILDSILNSQEKLLSKNSVMSLDSSGKVTIELKKKKNDFLNNNNSSKPDFNSYTVKQAPWHGRNYSGYRPNNRNFSNNRNWQSNSREYQGRYGASGNFGHGSSNFSGHYFHGRGQSNDIPQDYTRRTLSEAEMLQEEEKEKQTTGNSTPASDNDVDIYGDMEGETVSTTKADDEFRPPTPPLAQSQVSNTNTDEDNDSESGMVIDTERGLDDSVSSTVGILPTQAYSPGQPTCSPTPSTYSPGPSYNPGQPTYSPAPPIYAADQPTYSPGNPTGSPEGINTEDSSDPQTISLGYEQLQRDLASGYDQLQKEFASGLKQFQPLMNQNSSETNSVSVPLNFGHATNCEDQQAISSIDGQSESKLIVGKSCNDDVENGLIAGSQEFSSLNEIPVPTVEDSSKINSSAVKSTSADTDNQRKVNYDDDDSNDGCPNFSIYSRQSKSVALTTDISLPSSSEVQHGITGSIPDDVDPITDESTSLPESPQRVTVEKTGSDPRLQKHSSDSWNLGGLYSDSEDESVVKKVNSFAIADIKDMTEDILSEEDRSYTPVLDERADKSKEGLEGLDTEMISDDDRNDFDESHELKTVSDGDALEINAKESELEFTRPEDFEEGEIVDKNKEKVVEDSGGTPEKKPKKDKSKVDKKVEKEGKKKKKEKGKEKESAPTEGGANKENVIKESFKKLTKSSKERNYRDKDKKFKDSVRGRSRTRTPELTEREKETRKKKEKRKELERYNVRAIIADKPRPHPKDEFGRDLRQTSSRSRSRSYTPPLKHTSPLRPRRTPSPIRAPSPTTRRRSRSVSRAKTPPRGRRSQSKRRSPSKSKDKSVKRKARSRSRSGERQRDRPKTKRRKVSTSKTTNRRKKSKDKSKKRTRRSPSHSRRRARSRQSLSVTPRRDRREWTPSLSRSLTPPVRLASPSWTPPKTDSSNALRNQNLTVILSNDTAKKKKDKRGRERRRKDDSPSKRRRRERDRTPPPSKEVFASGDNILVSVSFNNENETRDISTRENRKKKDTSTERRKKSKEKKNKNRKDLAGVKPVAIIDLERSPFQEIESSPKDVIVLSDSDNNENDARNIQNNICDSSQQVASPEATPNYSTGPKTPPEPGVKFALLPKAPQLRAINNPLHDPLETIEEEVQEDFNSSSHKGPNTPLEEPPTSPPSSPDAYDPFEPTKSRSPTPEPCNVQCEIGEEQKLQGPLENIDLEKVDQTPDIIKSQTPPMLDVQPADSQSSIKDISEPKSPVDRIGVSANQLIQPSIAKPIAQTIPFSSVQTTITSSAPVSSTITISRISLLSSAIITPATTIPQRIVLPNQVKSSPVKILPTKAAVKSTPIKPMQLKGSNNKKGSKQQNGNSVDDANPDLESPYSPGSSDYEDLFEPPIEPLGVTSKVKPSAKAKRTVKKSQNTFDNLFGSPSYSKKTSKKTTVKKPIPTKALVKHIGVKVDEDSLKILEDLPNSAVEMQVKDKFLKKLNRQERVVEEVKLVLKPFYNKKKITKDEYKDIMRRAVPKICHNKTGEINPNKIRQLVEAYVKKIKHSKKVTSSSSLPQK